ncbi:MAG TPA: DUF6186 family protein [Streptosporangiaceae bacterium]|nr:DUF6186 family protein [Streptosporangiaceae bacterium]
MSSHNITVAGFCALALGIVGAEVAGRSARTSIPALSQVFTRIMRTRTGRVGVLVAWAWVGLHFFAK